MKQYRSLNLLISDLESMIEVKSGDLVEFMSSIPANELEEKTQMALETAYIAVKKGVDTEYARTKIIQVLVQSK